MYSLVTCRQHGDFRDIKSLNNSTFSKKTYIICLSVEKNLRFNAERCLVLKYTRKTQNYVLFEYLVDIVSFSVRSDFKYLGEYNKIFPGHIIEIWKTAYRYFRLLDLI